MFCCFRVPVMQFLLMFGANLSCIFSAVDHSSAGLTKLIPYRSAVLFLIHTLYIFFIYSDLELFDQASWLS